MVPVSSNCKCAIVHTHAKRSTKQRIFNIMHRQRVACKKAINVSHPDQRGECFNCTRVYKHWPGHYNYLTAFLLCIVNIGCNFSGNVLCGALARTCAAHELENVNAFSGALLWDYPDALLTYNYHVTFDNVAHHLTLGGLALDVHYNALVHHHIMDIYPLIAIVNLCRVVCGAIKVVRHHHILRGRF